MVLSPMLLGALEGIAHEILDRRQHRGDELRVLARRILGRDMRDEEPGVVMDEKDVLDRVDEGVLQHDLAEGFPGPPGLEPPAQAPPGEAVLQRFIERLEGIVDRLADRLADRRDDHGMENVDQRPGVVADRDLRRLLERRRQHLSQPRIR